jgi:hypothetical protein
VPLRQLTARPTIGATAWSVNKQTRLSKKNEQTLILSLFNLRVITYHVSRSSITFKLPRQCFIDHVQVRLFIVRGFSTHSCGLACKAWQDKLSLKVQNRALGAFNHLVHNAVVDRVQNETLFHQVPTHVFPVEQCCL